MSKFTDKIGVDLEKAYYERGVVSEEVARNTIPLYKALLIAVEALESVRELDCDCKTCGKTSTALATISKLLGGDDED